MPNASDWGYVVSALVTGIFGIFIAWQNYKLGQKTKTNHGKTIGQHVETAAADAAEAKLAAQLVALQLQEYKNQQATEQAAVAAALAESNGGFQKALTSHTDADAANFTKVEDGFKELRQLIVLGRATPTAEPI